MNPAYSEEKYPKFLDFEVPQRIVITLKDLSKYETMITRLLEAGITRVNGITFQGRPDPEVQGTKPDRRQDDLGDYARDLESALADIQLLGTERHVSLAHEFAVSMAQTKTAALDPLIADIRAELRRELKLGPLPEQIVVFRYYGTRKRERPITNADHK